MWKIFIRECTYRDIDSIFQLDQLWKEENVSYVFTHVSREDFIAEFERFQRYFLVAESNGQIIGYINGSIQTSDTPNVLPSQEPYLEIENIYVRPEFRNKQVGGALLKKLFEIAEQNGINRFFVSTVTRDMDRILRFYRSHGFKAWYLELFK